MDSDTLFTASTYLNNLLLARGLLRNGKALDFAKPTRDTRAQIINLVHDLLLRRDRDQEDREQIALSLRTLRADETRKDGDIERLRNRIEEKDRTLLQAQTDVRNLKVETRRLESNAKALQDQLARLKASVGHIKTQCANDVRKRDVHIERLKTHLQGQQRGNKGGVTAPMLSITGGSGNLGRSGQPWNTSMHDIQDPEYTLKQETNEFLTQLGQSLSDENDGLITMLKGTLQTMKELLGLDGDSQNDDETNEEHDTSEAYDSTAPPFSYEALATEIESTLDVLKTVLTSADFVSMDEVEARDEEILRLREGWVRMEARWKEVLLMINTWRAEMGKDGNTLNLDDLKISLGLGEGLGPVPSAIANNIGGSLDISTNDQDSPMSSERDSGIGHRVSPSPSKSSPSRSQRTTDDHLGSALDPPELFSHKKSAREPQLRRISPNIRSPRKVAFTEDVVKSSPLPGGQTLEKNNVMRHAPTTVVSSSEQQLPIQLPHRDRKSNGTSARSVSDLRTTNLSSTARCRSFY